MRRIHYLFTVMMVITVGMTSCKQDDGDEPVKAPEKTPEKTTTEKLTAAGWVTTGITITPPLLGVSDWFAYYEACEKDDIVYLKTDGTYTAEEGPTKCDPSDPQVSEVGTWKLSADEKSFTTYSVEDTITYVINELSETALKVTLTDVYEGVTYTSVMIFKH